MIDIKKLRDDFDATAAALGRRGVEVGASSLAPPTTPGAGLRD